MTEHRPSTRRLLIGLGLMAAVIAIILLSRPTDAPPPPAPAPAQAPAREAPAIAEPVTSDELGASPTRAPIVFRADDRLRGVVEMPNPLYQRQRKQHGEQPALRFHEEKIYRLQRPEDLPEIEPDWDEPLVLTWQELDRYRLDFDRSGRISMDAARRLNGAAFAIVGAVMPIDPVPEDGQLSRFWLANPAVVTRGCVFCKPPTMSDLIYVEVPDSPFVVDREELYRSVVLVPTLGRLRLGPGTTKDGVTWLLSLDFRETIDLTK
jgi:hypothetical protein